jgi:hypothetical protein
MPLETITRHPDSALMLPEIVKIRDCVKGAFFVKAKGYTYLPHPSALDTSSTDAQMRYSKYQAGAQFQGIPAQTVKSWVGKVDPSMTQAEVPPKLEYLLSDVDGDGMSLNDAISETLSNVAQVYWHVLVADFQGLTAENQNDVSVVDIAAAKTRAVGKQYTRENVFNWHFQRINNTMQLSYMLLREELESFDPDSMMRTKYNSYLALALDEEGNYYQQRFDDYSDGRSLQVGERHYARVQGKPLKWLPVRVVIGEPRQAGALPMEMGYLSPIVDLTLHNYVISADMKETMLSLAPTLNYYGVDSNAWEQFKEVNGRSYVGVGSQTANLWPLGVQAEILSAQTDLSGYVNSIKDNNDEMRSLGASFPTDSQSDKTATEVVTDSAEQASRLTTMAQCVEDGWRYILLYCGMFEGLWPQENIERHLDKVVVNLNKEFSNVKLTPQEVQQVLAAQMQGIISQDEALRVLVKGGWTASEYEELAAKMDAGSGMSLGLTGNA